MASVHIVWQVANCLAMPVADYAESFSTGTAAKKEAAEAYYTRSLRQGRQLRPPCIAQNPVRGG